MKHHKVKGVWRHRPDATPIADAACMGAKRKKGKASSLSKKHLFDKLRSLVKDVERACNWVKKGALPESSCKVLERVSTETDEVVAELLRRE